MSQTLVGGGGIVWRMRTVWTTTKTAGGGNS